MTPLPRTQLHDYQTRNDALFGLPIDAERIEDATKIFDQVDDGEVIDNYATLHSIRVEDNGHTKK